MCDLIYNETWRTYAKNEWRQTKKHGKQKMVVNDDKETKTEMK